MPDETITLYTKEAPETPLSCSRKEYYDNDLTIYKNHYPAIVDVFLFNTHGEVLLQKRGRDRRFNAGKLHTTVGGHINVGEDASFTVVHECMEELGAPVVVFSKEKYAAALAKLESYTRKAALLCETGVFFRDYSDDPIESRRSIKDRIWFYLGRYDGPIETPDRSSAGYEWISLDALEQEFKTYPDQFTDGLKIYVETFGDDMRSFIQQYCERHEE